MKKRMQNLKQFLARPKNLILSIVALIALIGIVVSIYYLYAYMGLCENESCFSNSLIHCKRASWINEDLEKTTQYKILYKNQDYCVVNVKLLQLKKGATEISSLEGKEMECQLPLGVNMKPEDNLKNCHGLLKEEIQEIIIQRMHSELIENLEQLGNEFSQVI